MINEQVLRSVLHTLTELVYVKMKDGETAERKEELNGNENSLLELINKSLIKKEN